MRNPDNPQPPLSEIFAFALLREAPCGFLVTDPSERAMFGNATLADWLGRDVADFAGVLDLQGILTRKSHLYYQTHVAQIIQLQGAAHEVACELKAHGNGEPLPVLMNAVRKPAEDGLPERIDFVFFDAAERINFERRLQERKREAEELAVIVRTARIGIMRCDAHGKIRKLNNSAADILGVDLDHLPDDPVDQLLCLDGRSDWFSEAVAGMDKDCLFEASNGERHFNISVALIANPEEPYAADEYSVIVRDVTKRVLAERRSELLVGELNHRVRNAFSVMAGLVSMTLRGVPNERGKLLERLQSVASSHNILTQNSWKDAGIRDVFAPIEAQKSDGQSVVIDGPDIRLSPNQFKALSMAVHELATNARKYGAFAADDGMIEIRWTLSGSDRKTFDFLWRESGGPEVSTPEETGFGTRMMTTILSEEFNGEAEIRYLPEGLEFSCKGEVSSTDA